MCDEKKHIEHKQFELTPTCIKCIGLIVEKCTMLPLQLGIKCAFCLLFEIHCT